MRSEVTVTFKGLPPMRINADKRPPMSPADARAWLDHEFKELGCEPPVRPTGKLLAADKLVAVAEGAGAPKFADEDWAQNFARAVTATLNRQIVNIDVESATVGF